MEAVVGEAHPAGLPHGLELRHMRGRAGGPKETDPVRVRWDRVKADVQARQEPNGCLLRGSLAH